MIELRRKPANSYRSMESRRPVVPLQCGSTRATVDNRSRKELPTSEQIEIPVREQLIVELHSK